MPAKATASTAAPAPRCQPLHRAPLLRPDKIAEHRHSASGRSSAISPGPKPLAGLGMHPDRGAGGLEGRHALRQQPGTDASQHVTGAGRGEQRRAVAVDRGAAIGRGDHRVRPLVDDDGIGACRGAARPVELRQLRSAARSGNRRRNSPSCGVSTSAGAPSLRLVRRIRRGAWPRRSTRRRRTRQPRLGRGADQVEREAADLVAGADPRPEHQRAGLSRAR